MRPVDVVLSVLTLAAVGMGVAAYQAWHPQSQVNAPVSDTRPDQSLVDVGGVRMQGPLWHPDRLTDVQCIRGQLYWHTPRGYMPVIANGHYSKCEIRAEPVHPQNSEASEQTP